MSETTEIRPAAAAAPSAASTSDPTDRPIPLWPEGLLVLAAGVTLLVVGLRHRTWIQKRVGECQRAVEEFQRHGGLEEIAQVARQAGEILRGK